MFKIHNIFMYGFEAILPSYSATICRYIFRINSVLFPYRSPIVLLLGNGKQYGNNTESNERRTNEVRRSKGG